MQERPTGPPPHASTQPVSRSEAAALVGVAVDAECDPAVVGRRHGEPGGLADRTPLNECAHTATRCNHRRLPSRPTRHHQGDLTERGREEVVLLIVGPGERLRLLEDVVDFRLVGALAGAEVAWHGERKQDTKNGQHDDQLDEGEPPLGGAPLLVEEELKQDTLPPFRTLLARVGEGSPARMLPPSTDALPSCPAEPWGSPYSYARRDPS